MWSGDPGSSSTQKTSSSHAKPEKSVTLRLYTMQKHHFLLAFTVFFALFFVSVLMGAASPEMVKKTDVKASSLQTNSSTNVNIPGGPFLLKSPKLSRYNQQLWLMVKFEIENNDETFSKNFTVMLSVVGLNKDLKKGDIIGYRKHNRTRSLQCSGNHCKTIIIMHLGFLPDSVYLVNGSFIGFERTSYTIKDLIFTWATYNSAFTQLELTFRWGVFIMTFYSLDPG